MFHVVQVWKVLECQQRYQWGRLGWVMLMQTWDRQSRRDGDRFIVRGVSKSWQRDFLLEDSKVKRLWSGKDA